MANIHDFDEIRPYVDTEVSQIVNRIAWEKGFVNFVRTFFPEKSIKSLISNIINVKSIEEFQKFLIFPMVNRIIKSSISNLTYSGVENIEKGKSYIYMSNHRDIVLDSALLEYILVLNNFPTTKIAIGSNLLILNWIIDLVRLNGSFIVKRDLPHVELYKYSVNLSKYIRFAITQMNDSIWLAQREGRTKDGDDQTQIAVLKMLNLSGENDLFQNLKDVNIIPVTISYEYEPCAVSKVQELYNKMINPDYKKTKLEDLTSMSKGMATKKGNVHYAFGTPINSQIHTIENIKNRKEKFSELKKLIDYEIYRNYKFSPFNYIAADIYFKTNLHQNMYSKQDYDKFLFYLEGAIIEIDGDYNVVKDMLLKIYAYPVKNYLKIKNSANSKS
ncbi:MAG: 1-acyl-sn-glycerol-3-phosphate acyltransferase [Bacteroidales bacterium]|nr:1-acyl-sn-glycerol-3-phosphate acyltransferase [Bacteroidales bacterium]